MFTPVDVFFYVLEGEGLLKLGMKVKIVVKGSLIDSPAKIPHLWRNDGDEDLRILIVKVPRPGKSTPRLYEGYGVKTYLENRKKH